MQAVYVRREWENAAQTIMSFYFRPERRFSYQAGQYTDLTIPHADPDNRGLTRTMTLSSAPHGALLRFTARVGGYERLSTFKQALLGLEPDASVGVTDAMGDMILPLDASIPLVFVAGGVGIASYASIISSLLTSNEKRSVNLLYAVKSTDDIAFQGAFDAYAAAYPLTRRVYTPNVNTAYAWPDELRTGRLTAAEIADLLQPDTQVYLSGSLNMVESLRSELEITYKVPQYRMAFDYFDGYVEA